MTNEEKQELLKNSEMLKKYAIALFDGQDNEHVVYALLHAASQINKEKKGISYQEACYKAMAILIHLQECSGCDEHPKKHLISS